METIASLFPSNPIRLSEISVYNWGTFSGPITAPIDKDGTLITGDNGSGKTTLIDAFMSLLLPPGKVHFNMAAAQEDSRSDRSLLSYMRGTYSTSEAGDEFLAQSKRNGSLCTAIRALHDAGDGKEITLLGVFWTNKASSSLSDVNKIYIVSHRNLTLQEVLGAFKDGNIRDLKEWLRSRSDLRWFDNNFSEYQEAYQQSLYMENPKAPLLLNRALGLKKINDLTGMIRELVLEGSTVKHDAREAVLEFMDLEATHSKLTEAKAQADRLRPMPEALIKLNSANEALKHNESLIDALPSWMAQQQLDWTQQKVDELEHLIEQQQAKRTDAERDETRAQNAMKDAYLRYGQCGGDRIEQLQNKLNDAKRLLSVLTQQAQHYQQLTEQLDIDGTLKQSQFMRNTKQAKAALDAFAQKEQVAFDALVDANSHYQAHQQSLQQIKQELNETKRRPNSNIPANLLAFREQLCEQLDIEQDTLPFVGELIQVKTEEAAWQGAIERALGQSRTTLLVSETDREDITRFLNQNHTGLDLRLQVVGAPMKADFLDNGILSKLEWQKHPYRDYLKSFLTGFERECVDSVDALKNSRFAITIEGLMKNKAGSYRKNDRHRIDDVSEWKTGFSNHQRIEALENKITQLNDASGAIEKAVYDARKTLESLKNSQSAWQSIAKMQWEDIDVDGQQQDIKSLQQAYDAAINDTGELEAAKAEYEARQADYDMAKKAVIEIVGDLSYTEKQSRSMNTRMQHLRSKIDETIPQETLNQLNDALGQYTPENFNEGLDDWQKQCYEKLQQQQSRHRRQRQEASSLLTASMSAFSERWKGIAAEWGQDLESAFNYVRYFEQLEQEGLPELVEKFQTRLNKHTTQSLAQINEKIASERDGIAERIERINDVLKRTEFGAGTHLKLDFKTQSFPQVREFERAMKKVFTTLNDPDHEARFHTLKDVIRILDSASDPATAGTKHNLRLLDARHRMTFRAIEFEIDSGRIVDTLGSSNGKSGGEKEAFAGTVVAASLAYVLTPDGYNKPVYSTVFLDEAFSNTSDVVSKRVLKMFKALELHVNMITPFKNLRIARFAARSLLVAEKDAQTNESRLDQITWEDAQRQLRESKKASRDLANEAEIVVHD